MDIYQPTFTVRYLSRKIPSSGYFWILFLRRQNNSPDNYHCYLFLHGPPPQQEDAELDPQKSLALYPIPTTTNGLQRRCCCSLTNPFSSDPWSTIAPEAEHATLQGLKCQLSIASSAVKDPSLVAAHPNPTNRTKTRSSKCVARLHPSTTTEEWSRSWDPRGPQLERFVVPQRGSCLTVWLRNEVLLLVTIILVVLSPQLSLGWWQIQGWRGPPPQRAHSTMSKKSGRGTVDQESASAGAMGLGTGRHGQQQIVDKAYVTEVYRSACHCGHE